MRKAFDFGAGLECAACGRSSGTTGESPCVSSRASLYESQPMKPSAPTLQQTDRTCVWHRGSKLAYFGGCGYYRLADDPRVHRALLRGLKQFGLNVAASRLTTGNHPVYEQLEAALTKYFGAESAVLVPSGYATNLVVAQAFANHFSHALMDERAHASLRDAALFLGCPVIAFPHRDVTGLARAVKSLGPNSRPILLTDGMFSSDGSVAPLKQYLRVLPGKAQLLVDDSHGAGVLGKSGRGTLEHARVNRGRIIQTITLSKAFGVSGGAILGADAIRRRLFASSRLLAGSTPLPLPLAVSALEAVRVLGSSASRRNRLQNNVRRIRSRLHQAGVEVPDHPGPIISVAPLLDCYARILTTRLRARQIFPSLIRYAGGSSPSFFRFAISSEHTRAQLDALADALIEYFGRSRKSPGTRG